MFIINYGFYNFTVIILCGLKFCVLLCEQIFGFSFAWNILLF